MTKHYVYKYLDNVGKVLYVGKTDNMVSQYNRHKKKPWFEKSDKCMYTTVENCVDQHLLEVYLINKENAENNTSLKFGTQPTFILDEPNFVEFNKLDFNINPNIHKKKTKTIRSGLYSIFEKRKDDIQLTENQKLSFFNTLFDRDNPLRYHSSNEEILIISNHLTYVEKELLELISENFISHRFDITKGYINDGKFEPPKFHYNENFFSRFHKKQEWTEEKDCLYLELEPQFAEEIQWNYSKSLKRLESLTINYLSSTMSVTSRNNFSFLPNQNYWFKISFYDIWNKFFILEGFPDYINEN